MKIKHTPKNSLEKFGMKIYSTLVENYPQTYYVGGTVRDLILKKELNDIDIATVATPVETVDQLKKIFVEYNLGFQKLGVVIAKEGDLTAAIATMRKDLPSNSRYPEVEFTKSEKQDVFRRDFTINGLYLQPMQGNLLDLVKGMQDIKNKRIRFIGDPGKRIKQDPLRIIRALRFALTLDFKLEKKTFTAIKKYFNLISELTSGRMEKEIEKIKNQKNKNILREVINNKKLLDKYF
jgi:tRNA nucleotidyltransferase/poly(A) polymerase